MVATPDCSLIDGVVVEGRACGELWLKVVLAEFRRAECVAHVFS